MGQRDDQGSRNMLNGGDADAEMTQEAMLPDPWTDAHHVDLLLSPGWHFPGCPPSFWEITSLFPGNHYVLSVRDSAYIYFHPHVLLRILVQVLTLHLCPNDLQTHVDINISIRLG